MRWSYIPNINALGLVVYDEDSFSYISYISLCLTCDPQERAHFWHQGYDLNKLGRSLLDNATYQLLRLLALWFQARGFSHFSNISLCKICDPQLGTFLTTVA